MIPRLLVPGPLAPGARATLDREASHHLCRVLRMGAGDPVQVFDGEGARHDAVVDAPDPRACTLRIGAARPSATESPLRVTLAQCISGGDRMDWTIEKAVELGVSRIVPLTSQRSVVRLDVDRAQRRDAHWRRLVVAACMQCGRDRLPALDAPQPLARWLASRQGPGFVLDPGAGMRLGTIAAPGESLDLLVGPESGLAPDEIAAAEAAGLLRVSLGPRVLRTETAAPVACALALSALGLL